MNAIARLRTAVETHEICDAYDDAVIDILQSAIDESVVRGYAR